MRFQSVRTCLLRSLLVAGTVLLFLAPQQLLAQASSGVSSKASLAQAHTLAVLVADSASIGEAKGLGKDQQVVLDNLKYIASGKEIEVYFDLLASTKIDTRIYVPTPAADKQKELEEKLKLLRHKVVDSPAGYWLLNNYDVTSASAKLSPLKIASRADLDAVLSSLSGSDIRFAVSLPDYVRKVLLENAATLGDEWHVGSAEQWLKAFKSMAIGASLRESKVRLVLQVQDAESAKIVASKIPMVLKLASSLIENHLGTSVASLVKQAAAGEPRVSQSQVEFEVTLSPANGSLLEVLTQAIVGPVANRIKMNRFRQIGLAVHNFHSAYNYLPPNKIHRDDSGKPRLSWRVSILPFINKEGEELYKQFHHDEPWDSPHNITLLPRMPEIFSYSSNVAVQALLGKKIGYTNYLAPVGKDTTFGGVDQMDLNKITDGTNNTIWIVEVDAAKAVPWTAPEDFRFDPKSPLDGMARNSQGNFLALMGDGSVMTVSSKVGNEALIHLFQINDGQPVKFE